MVDFFRAIEIEALGRVLLPEKQDSEYHIRRIFRAYSQKFNTPLHVVETLPLSEVLTHYWESEFEEMSEEDLELERVRLSESKEDRWKREADQIKEEVDDEEFVKQVEEELAEEERLKSQNLRGEAPISRHDMARLKGDRLLDEGDSRAARAPKERKRVASAMKKDSEILSVPPPEDIVKIDFVDAESFEREIAEDSLGGFKKK